MRAWHVLEPSGPAGIRLQTAPDLVPGPHEVLVRTRAVSLNYRDLLLVGGRYTRDLSPGAIPCSDAAGDVIAIGGRVTSVQVGERVTSTFAPAWTDGSYSLQAARSALGDGHNRGVLADAFMLPESGVMPAPACLSHEEASTLPCAALTAWHALFEESPATPGGIVLTIGTGGVSVFAIQFAAHAGLRVIATSRSDEKLLRARALGVAETLNSVTVPEWGSRARELAGGIGVDNVIELGGEGTLGESLRAVRFGGTVSLIGVLAPKPAMPVSLTPVLMRNVRLQGVMVGSRAMFERMNQVVAAGRIRPVIDRVFDFDRAPDAFAWLARGQHVGKVVIRVRQRD